MAELLLKGLGVLGKIEAIVDPKTRSRINLGSPDLSANLTLHTRSGLHDLEITERVNGVEFVHTTVRYKVDHKGVPNLNSINGHQRTYDGTIPTEDRELGVLEGLDAILFVFDQAKPE